MSKSRVSSGSPLEPVIGFSRAIRTGKQIMVAGTAPIEPDGSTTTGDAAAQMERCCAIVARAIADLGGDIADTVRTCIYLTDRADFDAVARVHGKWFGAARPATTTLIVSGFVRPEWKVEIEAEVMEA
ncbi:RidA family protein [Novosphingobium sp.]|uniref:RidA family protein n=1 Tax=Novosphingobium sp. TaxID=1874826 RepID=UPI002638F78E|nr:RidA family protein [Novosphingobium sp.]